MQPISPDEIKHFLVTLDVASGEVDVQSFDTDYDAAQDAYAEAERANMDNSNSTSSCLARIRGDDQEDAFELLQQRGQST